MNDTTQPQPAVVPPSVESLESILEKSFSDQPAGNTPPAPQAAPEEAPALTDPPDDGEPTAEDLQSTEEDGPKQDAAVAEMFEIVHNGQTVKLSRDEVIENARKGFDYDRKSQANAEKSKSLDMALQRVAQIEQLAPMVAQDMAMVRALETRLQQFQALDWSRLAAESPIEEFPKMQAELIKTQQMHQQAVGELNRKWSQLAQERQAINEQMLQQEYVAMLDRIPAWKDEGKFKSEVQEIMAYLIKKGIEPAEADGLNRAVLADIARDAMLYNRLKSLKADKSKQLRNAPPVVRPGAAASTAEQGKANFVKARAALRTAGQKGQHRTQERILEGLLNSAFK